jgi:hypothetical protein
MAYLPLDTIECSSIEESERSIRAWKQTKPAVIQKMVESHPPNRLYRMRSTGQRVVIYSYFENETVMVEVLAQYNLDRFNMIETRVFGILLDDLVECDLPDYWNKGQSI